MSWHKLYFFQIAWQLAISFWQFGTLPIGIFLSNLDTRQLMTSPRVLFGQFWHLSIFGNSRAIWVFLPKFSTFRKLIFSQWRSDKASLCFGVLGGQVPRLYDGTIFWGCNTPRGVQWGIESKRSVFPHIWDSLKGTWYSLIQSRISQIINFGLDFWISSWLAICWAKKCWFLRFS